MRVCGKCGTQCKDSALFCEKCGTSLELSAAGNSLKQKEPVKKHQDPDKKANTASVIGIVIILLLFLRSCIACSSGGTSSRSNYPTPSTTVSPSTYTVEHYLTDEEVYVFTIGIVRSKLAAPSTATFCSIDSMIIEYKGDGMYMVGGWVDAQNYYGAVLRKTFAVSFYEDMSGGKSTYKDPVVVFGK